MRDPGLREASAGARGADQHHRRRTGHRHRVPRVHDEPARGVRGRRGGAAGREARRRGNGVDARPRRGGRTVALRGQPRRRQRRCCCRSRGPTGIRSEPRRDCGSDRRPRGGGRCLRPDPVRQRVGRFRWVPGRRPRRSARAPDRQRHQGDRVDGDMLVPAARPMSASRSTRCRCRRCSASRRASTCPAIPR